MRIALISPPWVAVPPRAYGGTEAVIDGLARGLQAAGHDVTLFATGDSTCPVPTAWTFAAALGFDGLPPAAEMQHVLDAYECIAGEADVVHDHTLAGPAYREHVDGLPVVTTNHGMFEGALGELYRSVAARVPVIAISKSQASAAVDTPIAAVIHHGLDVDTFPLGDGGGGYALFLGRMSADKGVHTAISVARAAGMPLRIACKMREPAERAYFGARVEPLLGGDVEFLGEVGGAEKVQLLTGARCLLNPIAWPEPFGMVMIEAMACGTPVVATPMGAVCEVVDEGTTGLVRSTPAQLALAVIAAGELDRAACRQTAQQRFSISRMAADHVRLYETVVDRSPAGVS